MARTLANKKLKFLAQNDANASLVEDLSERIPVEQEQSRGKILPLYLLQAGITAKPNLLLIIFCLLCSLMFLVTLKAQVLYLSSILVPFVLGSVYIFLEKRIENRAQQFADDYPAVLMAMSSSVKAGLSPYDAMGRAIKLLPAKSIVRIEVELLLKKLHTGVPRSIAVSDFGEQIRLPELELFRNSFNLVLEQGGKFAPTLERLAEVCRDRSSLIRSARVTTATMRMTANILVLITPIIVGLVALRTKNFWDLVLFNPIANSLAVIGVAVIAASYLALIKMSNFKA